MSSPSTPVSGVLTDPGRTSPSTARADRRAPGVTGPGGSSRPCNGRRRRQQSTPRLDVQCPPTGRTSALGEGPARDWQIYVSRGSQGAAADQVGRLPSWSAAQTFLTDGTPSLREQECCDEPVSQCPVGGATAMQPASDQWSPNRKGKPPITTAWSEEGGLSNKGSLGFGLAEAPHPCDVPSPCGQPVE